MKKINRTNTECVPGNIITISSQSSHELSSGFQLKTISINWSTIREYIYAKNLRIFFYNKRN